PLVMPETSTGVCRSAIDPSPGLPQSFAPQHLTPPALVSAQVWKLPAATAAAPLVSAETSTGACRPVVVPSPSSPRSFRPQHLTPPPLVNAQVWSAPAATARAQPAAQDETRWARRKRA